MIDAAPPAARFSITPVTCVEYGFASLAFCIAFTTRVAAMSSMALVIFVDCTLPIRRRSSRSFAPGIYLVRSIRFLRGRLSPRRP